MTQTLPGVSWQDFFIICKYAGKCEYCSYDFLTISEQSLDKLFSKNYESLALPMTKILLISANHSLIRSLTSSLRQAGYQVIATSRGAVSLQLIQREKPALIILDVELPDYSSLAIVRSLRSDQRFPRYPLILIGVNMREEDAMLGWEAGADLCLLESFQPQVFIARVRSLLRRSQPQSNH
jgi:DNA-binding response OmpR family regulator